MRIRQIALVAADLEAALADLTTALGIEVAFRDPGVGVFGLANGVMPLGEHFLEVVSPKQEGTAAGRYLERRRGDGGYMVIFQTRDLGARRRLLEERGVRTVWEIALDDISTAHLHPRDTGAAIVSIDEARPWESWRWAGPDWQKHIRSDRVSGIAGVEIQGEDPDALARRWSEIFDLPFAAGDTRTLVLEDGGRIAFVRESDGRGEGIRSVFLRVRDSSAIREAAAAANLDIDLDGAVLIRGVRFVPDQVD